MKTVQLHIPTIPELLEPLPKDIRHLLNTLPTEDDCATFGSCYLESVNRVIQTAQREDVGKPVIRFWKVEKRGNDWFWQTTVEDLDRPWSGGQANFFGENTSQEVMGGGIMFRTEEMIIQVVGY